MIVDRFTYCCILDSLLLREEKKPIPGDYKIPIVIRFNFYEDNRAQLPRCRNRYAARSND
jgi:hypothetical protein